MSPLRAGRGRPGTPALVVLAGLVFAGCTAADSPPSPEADAGDDAVAAVLADSWHAAVVQDPAGLERMLDGPGGDGWLALFHGDLEAAAASFTAGLGATPGNAPCHLGLARVALARADLLRAERELARLVGPELVRYRTERADRVRRGRFEPALAALTLLGLDAPPDQSAAAVASATASTPPPDADPTLARGLRALIASRAGGTVLTPVDGLPPAWAARLEAAAAGADGVGDGGSPDLVDRLGDDAQSGLSFELSWWDPALGDARLRGELAAVVRHGANAGAAGQPLAQIASEAGGPEIPPATETADSEPSLAALSLLGSKWTNLADLRAEWQLPGGESFLVRLAGAVPDQSLVDGESAGDIDRVLRYAQTLLDASKTRLGALASEQGEALVRDLELPQKLHDHLLRQRMMQSLGAGEAVRALRLGERSLDVTGSKDGGLTRISHRNDAAYLVRLAQVHATGGRPGVARDYVHPLIGRFPALSAVSYTLGQLDAASSIGVQGKTSQQ